MCILHLSMCYNKKLQNLLLLGLLGKSKCKKLQNLCIMQLITDLCTTMQLVTNQYIEIQSIIDSKRKNPINIFHGEQKLYLSCWYSVLQ